MPNMNPLEESISLPSLIESVLFVASEPVPVTVLSSVLEASTEDIEQALEILAQEYHTRGIRLLRIGDRVHLTSSPPAARVVEKFLGMEHTIGLSRAALETLAIMAYRQPLTRPQVDSIRGVNSESVLENLMAKGLVEEIGRVESPGRPILYGTTPAFLQHFGLGSVAELPALQLEELPAESPPETHNGLLKE